MRSNLRMKNAEYAWAMANKVHKDQVDKAGEAYMGHVLRVSNAVTEQVPFGTLLYDQLWAVAILHDVVEDSEGHEEVKRRLEEEQSVSVILAVKAITHDHWHSEPYLDYLKRVKANDLARIVKIADIQDNVDPERMLKVLRFGAPSDFQRMTEVLTARYIRALDYLGA